MTLDDITSCMCGSLKSTAEEIYSAMNISISLSECKLLKKLINRLVQSENDLKSIIDLMAEIAEPYKHQLEILDLIPGIDKISALLILAEIGDDPFRDFETTARLCKWAGVVPRNDESADKIYTKKILAGNQHLKPTLVQSAWVAVKQRNTPFHHWFVVIKNEWGKRKPLLPLLVRY